MAKAANPLWNYKPRTQRIKLPQHKSLNVAAFLAWYFCYPRRFPDPGLSATQHLAEKNPANFLGASTRTLKYPIVNIYPIRIFTYPICEYLTNIHINPKHANFKYIYICMHKTHQHHQVERKRLFEAKC